MTGFEYVLALFSVLIGLTLTEIATDLHRLLRAGRAVRWDGRVILSTALVVEVTVRMWFTFWRVKDVEAVVLFPFYLSMFVHLMLLFMIGASCLPEEPPADGDLGAYYERNSRTLWTLFSIFQAAYVGYALYFNRGGPVWAWSIILLPLALYLLLAAVRRRWLDYSAPAAILAWELYWNWDRALGPASG
jgi:hypothetical protein